MSPPIAPALALLPTATAAECDGLMDERCQSTHCTDHTPGGRLQRSTVHCPEYVDPTRVTGQDENPATVHRYCLDSA